MVDLTSLKAFAGSFEIRRPDALRTLKLQPEPPGAMAAGARDLARRGYLGFVRLARGVGHDDLALRLAPGAPLADCPVVIALGDTVEALTIAPDLRRFVAGLMAYADLADPERKLSEAELAGLVELADEFQGARFAKQVLDAVPAARKIAAEAPRRGALWAALADDPTCEAIAGAWTHDLQRVPPMLAALSRTARQTLIARRLAVSHEVMFEGSEDVTRDAWSIVEANNLVDPTYTGAIAGPSPGSHTTDAMANAVTWLSNHDFSPPPDREALWKAALKREDELEYKGGEHLKAAEALADDAPEVAFEQMVSAAAYQARESGRVAAAALRAAADLARARSWEDLGQALDWAQA